MLARFKEVPGSAADKILLGVITGLCLALVAGSWVLSFLWFQVFSPDFDVLPEGPVFCVFKLITHLPCATCGMTRAMLLIASGQFAEAQRYHLLSLPLYFGAAGFLLTALAQPSLALKGLKKAMNLKALALVILLLAGAWAIKLAGSPTYW